jgi:hypothetical protein
LKPIPYVLFILCALGANGCVNLGPVREFASSSARLTDYKGVTQRYVTSADRQLADLPANKRFDATRNKLTEFKSVSANDKETLLKLHAATTGYMAALAGLAEQDAYSISAEIDQITGAITESKQLNINADHVQAYSSIVSKVANWIAAAKQARDVKQMVKDNGADMDKLLEAMQLATEAYGIVFSQEQQSAEAVADFRETAWTDKSAGGAALTADQREVVATLLRRSSTAETAAQADAIKAQKAAAAGLAEVRQAHLALYRNIDRLQAKDLQAALRKAASEIKAIRADIAKL